MCGIAGFLQLPGSLSADAGAEAVRRMADTLHHRGPDDGGIWSDPEAGIALGHRRLAIIDLSANGHQPMLSSGGRYVTVFNGEIYNFHQLRQELEKESPSLLAQWRGSSDTEVILAACEAWGVEAAVARLNGMFSIALWDRKERLLHLIRDRVGEKPLYYGYMGNTFLFGSELKSLQAHPAWRGRVNPEALSQYIRFSYVPAPYSIFHDIHKLRPGTMLTVRPGEKELPAAKTYWCAGKTAVTGIESTFTGSDEDAARSLEELLRDAVQQQMVADVPLGAFLSGGIDSSTIVALMQTGMTRKVKTFTIGYDEAEYNEADHARRVARHLGTDHTELYLKPADIMSVVPRLPELYDEPFGDSSQVPTFLLSQLARRHVTVSLSGDGGDELFGGYTRYLVGRQVWRNIAWLPLQMRRALSSGLKSLSADTWNSVLKKVDPVLPSRLRHKLPGDKLHKLADALAVDTPMAMYDQLVTWWKDPASVVVNGEGTPLSAGAQPYNHLEEFTNQMMLMDLLTYLPDDILVKVDRAAMGVSLETRVPFLDHRVVEFAWKLPLHMKIRNGQGKWLLRQVLYRHVPKNLIERPKSGFGIPIDSWLRGPLRDWSESLLNEKRLREEGFLHPEPIRQKWDEHLSGRRNWQHHLWGVLMFQSWLDATGGG